MKKFLSTIAVSVLALSLSGCTVNWFGSQYDVAWFVIAIPVTVIFIIAHLCIMSGTYVCSKCGTSFKPKQYQISAYIHFMGKRLIKCPKCKKMNYCKKNDGI